MPAFDRVNRHMLSEMPANVPPGQIRVPVAPASSLHRLGEEFMASGGMRCPEGRLPVMDFRLIRVEAVVHQGASVGGYSARKERLAYLRVNAGVLFNCDPSTFNGPQLHVLSALRDRYHELP